MKSMWLPLAAIFFMTYFHMAGGWGAWPPPPLDVLLKYYLLLPNYKSADFKSDVS